MFERAASESLYFIDVRTDAEFATGRIPGFRWFAGGQAVQRSDDVAVVHGAPIVFVCDGLARAALTASWYRQMGHGEVYALDGGTSAWQAAGRELTTESDASEPSLLADARASVRVVGATELAQAPRRCCTSAPARSSRRATRPARAGPRAAGSSGASPSS